MTLPTTTETCGDCLHRTPRSPYDDDTYGAWVPEFVEAAIRKEATAAHSRETEALWTRAATLNGRLIQANNHIARLIAESEANEIVFERWRTRAEAAEGVLRELRDYFVRRGLPQQQAIVDRALRGEAGGTG